MKKIYEKPILSIEKFNNTDIITASGIITNNFNSTSKGQSVVTF